MIAAYKLLRDRVRSGGIAGVTGVFMRMAPRLQATPYIIIGKESGVSEHVLAGAYVRNLVYIVAVVYSDETSMETAYLIDGQINDLLTRFPMLSATHKTISCQRESDVEYSEDVDGKTYWHLGGLYRPLVTPA